MTSSYSRLIVLVEDTSATSRLWLSWQRNSLEPLLHNISEGRFGVYELCLVAFSSTDGQSNALLQKTSWTTNTKKFSQSLSSLKFEGTCGGNALGDALSEAVYLSRQPSRLTTLENIKQHVLVCATGSIGRLPVVCPSASQLDGLHAFNILTTIASLGLTVSFLIEPSSNGILAQTFMNMVGRNALKLCQYLSRGKEVLALINPHWKDGFISHFPEYRRTREASERQKAKQIQEQAFSEACADSSSSAKTSLMVQTVDPQDCQKQEVEEGPVFQSDQMEVHQDSQAQGSCSKEGFLEDPLLSDAVDLTAWQDVQDQDKADQTFSSLEMELALEKERLCATNPSSTSGLESSDRKRKILDTNGLSNGYSEVQTTPVCPSSDILGSSSQNKPSTESDPTVDFFVSNVYVGTSARQNLKSEGLNEVFQIPRSSDHCNLSLPRTHNIKNCAPTVSPISIENKGEHMGSTYDHKLFSLSNTIERASQPDGKKPFNDMNYVQDRQASSLYPSASDLHSSSLHFAEPKHHQLLQRQGNKRLRTDSRMESMNSPFDMTNATGKPWSNEPTPTDTDFLAPVYQSSARDHWINVGEVTKPNGGCRGTVYLAGHLLGVTEPQKLFEVEIQGNRRRNQPLLSGHTGLLVKDIRPKDSQQLALLSCCSANIYEQSITRNGQKFLGWLYPGNCVAVVDVYSDSVQRLVLTRELQQDTGAIRLVARF